MGSVDIRQIEPSDDELSEEWEVVTDEEDIMGVGAVRSDDDDWPWQVFVCVAEFIRTEPLQSELFRVVSEALTGVSGVLEAAHEDREIWVVRGDVGGEALVRAAARAVASIADRTRAAFAALTQVT